MPFPGPHVRTSRDATISRAETKPSADMESAAILNLNSSASNKSLQLTNGRLPLETGRWAGRGSAARLLAGGAAGLEFNPNTRVE